MRPWYPLIVGPTVALMTEPPRPAGEGNSGGPPPDPTAFPPPSFPVSGAPATGGYPPPTSGGGSPPASGAGAGFSPDGGHPPGHPPDGGHPPGGAYAAGGHPPGGGYPDGGYPPGGGYPGGAYPGGSYPGGGYPGGGYPPGGGYGVPPGGYPSNDERTWALIAHLGGAAGAFVGAGTSGWIAPLIALLARGNQSPTVRAHAVAALNFQLLWTIIAVAGWVLICLGIGFVIGIAAWLFATVVGIIAGVRASNGEPYRYPASMSVIK